jgi:hypothetical protein
MMMTTFITSGCGACKTGKLIPLFKTRVAKTIKKETTTNDISPHGRFLFPPSIEYSF